MWDRLLNLTLYDPFSGKLQLVSNMKDWIFCFFFQYNFTETFLNLEEKFDKLAHEIFEAFQTTEQKQQVQ